MQVSTAVHECSLTFLKANVKFPVQSELPKFPLRSVLGSEMDVFSGQADDSTDEPRGPHARLACLASLLAPGSLGHVSQTLASHWLSYPHLVGV